MENNTILDSDNYLQKDVAKILAMLTLGVGSFVVGILPAFITENQRRKYPLVISILMCFGAGVLLATALVHILPEIREDMPNYAEIVFCAGFFFVYLIDELVHFCFGEAIQHHAHADNSTQQLPHTHGLSQNKASNNRYYGSGSETRSLLHSNNNETASHCHHDEHEVHVNADLSVDEVQTHREICINEAASNARICHTSHVEPCESSLVGGQIGLLVALSIHSFLEGLAIGVQDTGKKVTLLIAAVASHKFVVGFCLGVELCANQAARSRNHFKAITVFSLGSVLGIGLGMGLDGIDNAWKTTVLPALQALVGGTLLYVTVCEVLPREKARWHQSRVFPGAGLVQLVSVVVGFAVMCSLTKLLSE